MNVAVRDAREPGGVSTRRGAPTGVPGLAVAAAATERPGTWVVVHVRSGLVLADFGDPEAALAGAQAAAGLADWTAAAAGLRYSPGLRGRLAAALAPAGGSWRGALAPSESLADLTEAQP